MTQGNSFWGKDNLFWGMQFRICKNFWDFADSKSSLNPKNSYKYKSHTAITSIVVALATNLKNKCESLLKFLLLFAFAKSRVPLNLVIARRIADLPKQSTLLT